MQAVVTIDALPDAAIEAATEFHRDHIDSARAVLASDATSLVVSLPAAPKDHDDWRRALARDLARAYAPKRVNVVGASDPEGRAALLAYLEGAPGITGQYLVAHE